MSATVAVLGPGAVGGALAVRLANAGIRTVCVADEEAVGVISLAGLVLETGGSTLTARCETTARLSTPVDLLLVTVKAPMLPEALDRVDPVAVEGGLVVPLLNGIEHMDVLRDRFDGRVLAGTIAHYRAHRAGRVQIVEATPHPVVTVASDTVARDEVEAAADVLRSADIDTRVGRSEKRVLWHKLVRMAPLVAVTAASGRTLGELRHDPDWWKLLQDGLAESCAVASAEGVSLVFQEQWTVVDRMADETTTSTARDVAAGRSSELDAIVGAVLRLAERHGIPCPALSELATKADLL
jgi:2-dehydropantoate 2-reductase